MQLKVLDLMFVIISHMSSLFRIRRNVAVLQLLPIFITYNLPTRWVNGDNYLFTALGTDSEAENRNSE